MNYPFVPAGAKVREVGELTQEIKDLLEDGFASVWVAGEVSSLTRPQSGHVYLTLKDATAKLDAVIYRGFALRLPAALELKVGLQVVACGRISVYPPKGNYQYVIERLYPKGQGAAELALRQLTEKLFGLGYFDPRRKRPLPSFPRRIALVTSPTGAAVRDMLEVLSRRWPAAEVVVCPVRVQGEEAPGEIAAAVRWLNRLHDDGELTLDVMIVGRGGGSSEDLSAFNEELVAHAIFGSGVPVVSAVGHETDVTIADKVADRRALTPTEAATTAVPSRDDLLAGLRDAEQRLLEGVKRRLDLARQRLNHLTERRAFRLPLERVHEGERRLDDWADRLKRAGRQQLDRGRERVEAVAARLESLSPLGVLARGYSLTQTAAGELVRDVGQLRLGDRLRTRLGRGEVVSQVEEIRTV
jgi:exodeoxyribonuclease VII large subunit